MLEDELQQRLGQIGVIGKIGERDLRLDHPEFGEMAAGVRVLGAEGRAEGVDLGEREAVGLDIELARDGEEGFPPEKILREVHLALRRARQVREIERRDAKQSPRAFGVRGGDDRRVDPEKAVLVEEPMDRLRQRVAHARCRSNHVGARPQMRHVAQEFQRMRLRLDRIVVRVLDPPHHAHRARLHLEGLPFGGRRHDAAGGLHRAAGGEPLHFARIVRQRVRRHHLHRMEARAIREVDERDAGLRIAPRAHPAADRDRTIARRAAAEDVAQAKLVFHVYTGCAGEGEVAWRTRRLRFRHARSGAPPTS